MNKKEQILLSDKLLRYFLSREEFQEMTLLEFIQEVKFLFN